MAEMDESTDSTIGKIFIDVAMLKKSVIDMETTLKKHHCILIEGNGQLPIVETVRNHQEFISSTKFWMKAVVLAVMAQVITLGVSITVYMVKIYPLLENIRIMETIK